MQFKTIPTMLSRLEKNKRNQLMRLGQKKMKEVFSKLMKLRENRLVNKKRRKKTNNKQMWLQYQSQTKLQKYKLKKLAINLNKSLLRLQSKQMLLKKFQFLKKLSKIMSKRNLNWILFPPRNQLNKINKKLMINKIQRLFINQRIAKRVK